MKDYPYGYQSDKKTCDVVIPVKLFDLGSSICWWLAEYDPESKIAFGYVTGFYEDEWGDVFIPELEELKIDISVQGIGTV